MLKTVITIMRYLVSQGICKRSTWLKLVLKCLKFCSYPPWQKFDTLLSRSKLDPLFWFTLIQFWYTQKCIKYTLIHSKVYQIMIDDRKSYLNCMKCVWNGVKRYQILCIKTVSKVNQNKGSNFDLLKSVSKFSQGNRICVAVSCSARISVSAPTTS